MTFQTLVLGVALGYVIGNMVSRWLWAMGKVWQARRAYSKQIVNRYGRR